MLVSLEAAAAQPIPALFGIRPEKSAYRPERRWGTARLIPGGGVGLLSSDIGKPLATRQDPAQPQRAWDPGQMSGGKGNAQHVR